MNEPRLSWVAGLGANGSVEQAEQLLGQLRDKVLVLKYFASPDDAHEIATTEKWIMELEAAILVRTSWPAERVDTWRRLVLDQGMTCQDAERAAEGIHAQEDP